MKQINKEIEYRDLLETKLTNNVFVDYNENFGEFVENAEVPKLSLEELMPLESELTPSKTTNPLETMFFLRNFRKHSLI